jgi:hypothetical protein
MVTWWLTSIGMFLLEVLSHWSLIGVVRIFKRSGFFNIRRGGNY